MLQRTGPLARREFRLYFAGNLASNVGTWLSNVALSVYVRDLTNSSFWVGLTNSALFVPVLMAEGSAPPAEAVGRMEIALGPAVVRVGSDVDAAALRRVLDVVRDLA